MKEACAYSYHQCRPRIDGCSEISENVIIAGTHIVEKTCISQIYSFASLIRIVCVLLTVPSWRVNVVHSKYVMEGTEVSKA